MKKIYKVTLSAMGLALSLAATPLLQQNVFATQVVSNTDAAGDTDDTDLSTDVSDKTENTVPETEDSDLTEEMTEPADKSTQSVSSPSSNDTGYYPAKPKNGFYKENGVFRFYENGMISNKTSDIVHGIIDGISGWYYIENGVANLKYTGVKNNIHGWWYVKNGKVDFSYNGFAKNENGWWYCENGKVTFSKSEVTHGVVNGISGWWNVKGSNVKFNESVEPNQHGWWYIKNGKVDFSYNDFAKNHSGWWYIENGKVTFKKNEITHGTIDGLSGWWNVKGSNVIFNESVEPNQHGWWYVKNGKVDFSYNGFAKNHSGWWYIANGKVSFKRYEVTHGTVNGETAWWNVQGSKVMFNESVEPNSSGWWYVKDGKVLFDYSGNAANSHGLWYIQNGKVRFNANGWKEQNGKKSYIINGRVSTGATKINSDYYLFDERTGFVLPNTEKLVRNTNYNTDNNGKITSVDHKIKNYINQLNSFGKYPMACAAAASLMALQANGYADSLSGQSGWDSLLASFRAIRGSSFGNRYGVGVSYASQLKSCIAKNPATASVPTYTVTGSGITLAKIMDNLAHGQTFVPLVKLKSSTHWIAVTGWYKNGNTTMYRIADPWPKDGKPSTNYVSNVFSRAEAFYSDKLSGTELIEIIKAPIIYDWHDTPQGLFIGSYMNV